MKVSVIIPYYQRKLLLIRTLRSLMEQDIGVPNYEILVIDDGSTDLEASDLADFADNGTLRYHRFVRDENSCAALSRNRGAEVSRGEILIFLDCDQIVQPTFCSKHYEFHLRQRRQVLQFGPRSYLSDQFSGQPSTIESSVVATDERLGILGSADELMSSWSLVFSHNISFPRELVSKLGGFDPKFRSWGLEDVELAFRFASGGIPILFNPEVLAYHQAHEDNYDLARYQKWHENLQYFRSKYCDLRVDLLSIFEDFFDPARWEALNQTIGRNVWVFCCERFENCLRVLAGDKSLVDFPG